MRACVPWNETAVTRRPAFGWGSESSARRWDTRRTNPPRRLVQNLMDQSIHKIPFSAPSHAFWDPHNPSRTAAAAAHSTFLVVLLLPALARHHNQPRQFKQFNATGRSNWCFCASDLSLAASQLHLLFPPCV